MRDCDRHPGADKKKEPAEGIHQYKWVCGECGKWLCWAKKERTSLEIETRRKEIREIISKGRMNTKQLEELLNIYIIEKMNYKQQTDFNNITA